MKTSSIVILAGAGIAVLFILTRSKTPLVGTPSTTTNQMLLAGGAAAGGLLAGLFGGSKSSSSGTSVSSSGGSVYIPDTATSNYLADATAASDNSSGVVGFGGWDD